MAINFRKKSLTKEKIASTANSASYWIFILNSFCDALFCSIDTAFGNYISTDVIAALGSFWTIHWLLVQIVSIGIYAYQVWRQHPYNCIFLCICTGLILGSVVIVARVPISHIFTLTDVQYKMLQDCLLLDGATLAMEAASRFVMAYITYSCHNKLMILSNALTFVLLIGTDYLSVKMEWGCIGLVASTQLTWLVYLIVVVIGCKFWKLQDKIHICHLKECIKKSYNMLIYRVVSRVANLCYGHFASTLGPNYVLHALCISVTDIAEEFRNGIFNYQMVLIKAAEDKISECRKILKRHYLSSLLLMSSFSFIVMFFIHGKVPLNEVILYLAVYTAPCLIWPIYDSLDAFLTTTDNTKSIAWRGLISCIWRIPIVYLFIQLGFGLFGVASIVFLDYAHATIYFLRKCNWLRNTNKEA